MVATTPPKQNKILVALNPVLTRETLNKVDQCVARLQKLQYTVAGGTKVVSGVSLSPRSTTGYLRTSLRCKQESLRIEHDAPRRPSPGKFPRPTKSEGEEWRQMSLPAMLVGETVGEILQASQFAREIVSAVCRKKTAPNKVPKTPLSQGSNQKVDRENTQQLNARRRKEKQIKPRSDTPPLQRARLRINFKVSPSKAREFDKENNNNNNKCVANRPCASNSSNKTVFVPNPLCLSTHSSRQQQQFYKTKYPVISRNMETQHKFLIKSPPQAASKFQVKDKNPSIVSVSSSSPTRPTNTSLSLSKKSSPKRCVRPFSPSRVATRLLASPLKSKKTVQKNSEGLVSLGNSSPKRSVASKLRSFSPSRLAKRLVSLSPLKSRKSAQQSDGLVSGMKQRPASTVPASRT